MNYLYYSETISYPSDAYLWSPDEYYPEYLWSGHDVRNEKNSVYGAIRKMLENMNLDKENYGSRHWNPLGEYIRPGQTVVLKPNFVMHKNGSDNPSDLESLVTHPSILRCVIDYCLIALKGRGRIIVADSPVKDCNFKELMKKAGYEKLKDFYQKENSPIMPEFYDLRGPGEEGGEYQQAGHGVLVNLSNLSFFFSQKKWKKYRIPNYDYRKVRRHHKGNVQAYMINSLILDADVIISLPKPKTHRKNGYTGALKNFVGVNYSKEYLPHHSEGDVESGGDEYVISGTYRKQQTALRKKLDIRRTRMDFIKRKCNETENPVLTHCYQFVFSRLEKNQKKGWGKWNYLGRMDDIESDKHGYTNDMKVREGMWYGNDTLWRTVLDLNIAVMYSDKRGVICPEKQRKILYLGDMVISGEGEGPLAPTAKREGAILFAENSVEFDLILVKLMGFDWEKLKGLYHAADADLLNKKKYDEIVLNSNCSNYNGYLKNLNFQADFTPFEAASGWKGYIELDS